MFTAKSQFMLVRVASFATVMACSTVANASLYVSPVVKDEAVVNYTSLNGDVKKGELGELKTSVVDDSVDIVMTSGKDLPLYLAVDNVAPSSYQVHFQDGIHEMEVTWSGGNDWKDTMYVMARQNNLNVYINEKEAVVGISVHPDMAFHLAKKVPTVWHVQTALSLRENLLSWASQAGWQLEWDADLDIDYPAPHDAVFMGDFVGKGGVVEELLSAYKDADVPLKPKFYLKNRVLLITKGGHEQSLRF